MHTKIAAANYAFWILIIVAQGLLCLYLRDRRFSVLRFFLISEVAMGAGLATLAKTVGPWTYFYSWIGTTLLQEVVSAVLIFSIVNTVRKRALPSRILMLPLQIAVASSLGAGIYASSRILRSMANMPSFRIINSWDHAFWYAACCMITFTPVYAWCVGATIPRHLALVLAGFSIYAASSAGLLAIVAIRHGAGMYGHLSDVCYCFSLLSWYLASRWNTEDNCAGVSVMIMGPSRLNGTEKES